ncbi:MAG: dihydroorotase [Bacteroidia bacterium]
MASILIKNGLLINEGERFVADLFIENGRIIEISKTGISRKADKLIDAQGCIVVPGVVDDQVHFREPGLTHKAEIYTEAKAAVAGGVTSYMEMPNTKPQAVTQEILEEKYVRASQVSMANYSFFMGGTNDNLEELKRTNPETVCGVKLFMGSSTGNMLVDNVDSLKGIFSEIDMLIATHCEDEETIRTNMAIYKEKYGEDIPFSAHPEIRNHEACYKSSSLAISLAKEFNARLHILHISTADELELFSNEIPLIEKRITSEVCVHHLTFNKSQYETKGSLIKCNPAIKSENDRLALWDALLDNRLDVVATDHAPHTWDEKQNKYLTAPSGLPLVQQTLCLMLRHADQGRISYERVIEKMCHAPADLFRVRDRGYLREGYWADIAIVKQERNLLKAEDLLYKCGWSPMEGEEFNHKVTHTIISGHLAYENGEFDESVKGQRMLFG